MRFALLLLLPACATDVVAETDEMFYDWDGERVLCGLGVDGEDIPLEDLEAGMVRARDHGEVVLLFAHQPGVDGTIDPARLDAIFTAADRVGLPYLTFPELGDARTAGLAFSFDDAYVDEWSATRAIFAAHGARVTFFVSNYDQLTATQRGELHALAADGHAIEAHGMGHRNAPAYVDEHGLDAYLADEIDPLLAAMRADGFAPTTFAYPFGDRTPELDEALLTRFETVRSLTYLGAGSVNTAPCPR